jgi:transcriptional regulator with XRE-family HTH domain
VFSLIENRFSIEDILTPDLFREILCHMEPANDTTPPIGPLSFGDRLRTCREAAGLTQKQVATYVDCHHTTVSKIEADCFDPSVDLLRKIFLVYAAHAPVTTGALSADYLLFGIEGRELYAMATIRYDVSQPLPEDVE